jgi:hypothetical protein
MTRRGRTFSRRQVAAGAAVAVIFGHAIYESLALGVAPAVAAAIVLGRDPLEPDPIRDADAGLARSIEDGSILRSPRELTRVDVQQAIPRAER